MKKYFYLLIVLLFVSSCTDNKKQASINNIKSAITEDSVASWFFNKYKKFTFCINGKEPKSLNDSIFIKYMSNISPKVDKYINDNIDDPTSFQDIETYIGTDYKDWIVYRKFRSKVSGYYKIQFVKYDTSLMSECGYFCQEKDYPAKWKDIVSTINNSPYPYPSELDNKIFNKSTTEIILTSLDKEKSCINIGNYVFINDNGKITKEEFK